MRREFSAKVREQALARATGKDGIARCENKRCRAVLKGKRFDHRHRDADGGEPTLENCQVLCIPCHVKKTAVEHREHHKAIRARRKHQGTDKPPAAPIPKRWAPPAEPKPKTLRATATPEKLAHLPRRNLYR